MLAASGLWLMLSESEGPSLLCVLLGVPLSIVDMLTAQVFCLE